jgi:hypothetical protein
MKAVKVAIVLALVLLFGFTMAGAALAWEGGVPWWALPFGVALYGAGAWAFVEEVHHASRGD